MRHIDFVPAYYRKESYIATYAQDFFLIYHEGDWELPPEAEVIKSCILKRQAQRPKEMRYRSKAELFHPYHHRYYKCGQMSHNKTGCKV